MTKAYDLSQVSQTDLTDIIGSSHTIATGNLGAAATFDMALGNSYTGTVDQITTITLSNPPIAPKLGVFVLTLTNGGAFAITWPGTVVWDTAAAPTLQAAGVDIIQLITTDAGTTYRGVRVWKQA